MIENLRQRRADWAARFRRQFHRDVLRGLSRPRKQLPCKYFYDDAGSALFERITELDEYYPTRVERSIMIDHAAAMAALCGPRCLLIEYGSGSSMKTRLLLDHLDRPSGYVPVDISRDHLRQSADALGQAYPHVDVYPLFADFTRPILLPPRLPSTARRVVYFPGSTIGNFAAPAARRLLKHTAQLCGPGGGLLLGVDLRKDPAVLHAAYNDSQGVTAEFNRNVLARVNRELEGDFNLAQFAHEATYNEARGRIEMRLISRRPQVARVGERAFEFAAGEAILTEYSHKYDLGELAFFCRTAGFETVQTWTDDRRYFAVAFLRVASGR